MKNLLALTLLFPFLILSCNNKPNRAAGNNLSDTIPEGAIPFEYKGGAIFLAGTYNDTLLMNYFFDTGWAAMSISDVLRPAGENQSFVKQPGLMRIGEWSYTYDCADYIPENDKFYRMAKRHPDFEDIFKNKARYAAFDWKFFENKIIEISYRYKYIKELPDTKSLNGYDMVKIKRENIAGVDSLPYYGKNKAVKDIKCLEYNRLGVPITIVVQGKKIEEYVFLDTGYNHSLTFNPEIIPKYNIGPEGAVVKDWGYEFYPDTIRIGKNPIPKSDHFVWFVKERPKYEFSGLLGNKILENYTIVLDLKNYNMYLKLAE